MSSEMFNS